LCDFAQLDAESLKVLAWRYGHVVMEQFRMLNMTEMEAMAAQFGDLLRWSFGYTFVVKPVPDFRTTVASRLKTPLHFDGMLHTHVPSFQLFQCIKPPTDGGETTFVHTIPITEDAPKWLLNEWLGINIHYYTTQFDYFGGVHRVFPLAMPHPFVKNAHVVLFHEKHEGDVTQPVNRTVANDRERYLIADVERYVLNERFTRYHKWRANQFVLADNIGQLHGKRPFPEHTEREFWRIHIM